MIDGGEPPRIECRGDPQTAGRAGRTCRRAAGSGCPRRFAASERFELRGGRATRAHELHLVEHPLRIFVEQRELHRPQRAGRGVAAHQRAAQQHVLGAHEHRRALRRRQPAAGVDASHEHAHVLRSGKEVRALRFGREPAEPLRNPPRRLFDQRPHRQAPDEPAGRGVRIPQPVRRPAERHRGRLARAGRGHEDPRPGAVREGELPPVGAHVRAASESPDGRTVQVAFSRWDRPNASDHSGGDVPARGSASMIPRRGTSVIGSSPLPMPARGGASMNPPARHGVAGRVEVRGRRLPGCRGEPGRRRELFRRRTCRGASWASTCGDRPGRRRGGRCRTCRGASWASTCGDHLVLVRLPQGLPVAARPGPRRGRLVGTGGSSSAAVPVAERRSGRNDPMPF